jgi:single-stranded-DNA-specific exonuclease
VAFHELTLDLFAWLERCAPFGMENPEPVFVARRLTLAAPVRTIKERHICLQLQNSESDGGKPLSALGWSRNGALSWPERCAALGLTQGSVIDAVFHLRMNSHPQYGGLELELIDIGRANNPDGQAP